MQALTQLGVIDPQVPPEGVDPQALWSDNLVNGVVDLVRQGEHITRITGIARGHLVGQDQAGGRLRQDTGLATKLGRAVALACDDRSNGGVLGIDNCALGQLFTLGEALRLLGDRLMGGARCFQVTKQPLALGLAAGAVLGKALSGLRRPCPHGFPEG